MITKEAMAIQELSVNLLEGEFIEMKFSYQRTEKQGHNIVQRISKRYS